MGTTTSSPGSARSTSPVRSPAPPSSWRTAATSPISSARKKSARSFANFSESPPRRVRLAAEVHLMPDAPPGRGRTGTMDARGRRGPAFLVALLAALLGLAAPARAGHDPNRTVTVYVHGFDHPGAGAHGVYGADVRETLEERLAAVAGLPVAR